MRIKKILINIYEKIYPYLRKWKFNAKYHFRVMLMEETITYIKENHCSISRYGDGEFGIITNSNNPDFQKTDTMLAERLADISKTEDDRLLICIPHNFKSTNDCNEFAEKFWNWWLWENDNLEKIAHVLNLNAKTTRVFGDAQITRPYMDWKDKSKVKYHFQLLKSLWEDREVLFVEGEHTKLGVGNDLFDNVASIQRVVAPAKNAFSQYNYIFECAKKWGKDKLILIALGPTATILAYDLAMLGYQALDIGHIDIEYEWFLKGAEKKEAVCGKDTQEAHVEIDKFSLKDEERYCLQIVERIVEEENDA